MVKITGFEPRKNERQETFNVLVLESGIELIKSEETGQVYATSRKATIACTFDDRRCESLIGNELPGSIQKEKVEPYEYTIKETGEKVFLDYRFSYKPEPASMADFVFSEDEELI